MSPWYAKVCDPRSSRMGLAVRRLLRDGCLVTGNHSLAQVPSITASHWLAGRKTSIVAGYSQH